MSQIRLKDHTNNWRRTEKDNLLKHKLTALTLSLIRSSELLRTVLLLSITYYYFIVWKQKKSGRLYNTQILYTETYYSSKTRARNTSLQPAGTRYYTTLTLCTGLLEPIIQIYSVVEIYGNFFLTNVKLHASSSKQKLRLIQQKETVTTIIGLSVFAGFARITSRYGSE